MVLLGLIIGVLLLLLMLKIRSADGDKFDIEQVRKAYKQQMRKQQLSRMFEAIRKTIMSHPQLNKQPIYLQQPLPQAIYLQQPNHYYQYLNYILNAPRYFPQLIPLPKQAPLQIQQQKESNVYLQKNGVVIYKRLLGSGTYSQVWEGKIKRSAQKIAAKQVKKLEPNELKCLTELSSEYIIKVIDIFTHSQKTFIILQYCDRNLRDQLKNCNFQIQKVLKYFEQIIYGIDVLQQRNIIHRDLKFENILLKESTIKIADFGLAKFLQNHDQVESRVCGTPYTMAPQIFFSVSRKAPYTIKSDIWSIGVILHEMLYRCHPFKSDSYQYRQERRVRIRKRFGVLDKIIDKCLVFNPAKRINWNELKTLFTNYRQQRQANAFSQKQANFQLTKIKNENRRQQREKQVIKEQQQREKLQKCEQKQIKRKKQPNYQVDYGEQFKLQNVKQVQSIIYEVPLIKGKEESQVKLTESKQEQDSKQIVHIKKGEVKVSRQMKVDRKRFVNELIILIIAIMSGVYLIG